MLRMYPGNRTTASGVIPEYTFYIPPSFSLFFPLGLVWLLWGFLLVCFGGGFYVCVVSDTKTMTIGRVSGDSIELFVA